MEGSGSFDWTVGAKEVTNRVREQREKVRESAYGIEVSKAREGQCAEAGRFLKNIF